MLQRLTIHWRGYSAHARMLRANHEEVFVGHRMLHMRWALVILKSFVIGGLGTLVCFVAFVIGLTLYTRYALGIPPDAAVGWDVVSLFGQHWKVILVTISLAIFGLGFCLAFRRFGRRIQASSR